MNLPFKKTPFLSLIYTSTATQMFRKTKVDYNPQHWQPIFCPVYALACTLSVDQPFDKCKEKNTTGIYLGIFTIHGRTSALVPSLITGEVPPQSHIEFDTYLTTINVSNGNIVPPRYWQAMYGFVKGNNLAFMHYEKHNPPTALFSSSYQGFIENENAKESEEKSVIPVQEDVSGT